MKFVRRQRLLDMIEKSNLARFTLIVAPPGYGKTVLVEQWAQQTKVPVCRVSVDGSNPADVSQSARILNEIAAWFALRKIHCEPSDFPSLNDINVSAKFGSHTVGTMPSCAIVLDDLDALPGDELSSLLNELFDNPSIHVIAVCRRYPEAASFGIAAKSGRIREITADDMRFTDDEVEDLLGLNGATDVSPSVRTIIFEQSAGWAAGISMDLIPSIVRPEAQSHFLFDTYISHVILDALPTDALLPLFATLGLRTIDEPVWNAMFSPSRPAVSFSNLIAAIPHFTDEADQTYRHLPQVERSLQRLARELDPDERWHSSGRRVLIFLEKSGRNVDAIRLALRMDSEQDALRIATSACRNLALCDLHEELLQRLEPIPPETLLLDENLVYWSLIAMLSCGQIKKGRLLYDQIAGSWAGSTNPLRRGRLMIVQMLLSVFDGRREQAIATAQQALDILPDTAVHERFRAASSCSVLSAHLGNHELSRATFEQAKTYRSSLPRNQAWWHIFVLPDQADRLAMEGDLQAAASLYDFQLATFPEDLASRKSLIHLRLSLIKIEQNQLTQATSLLGEITRLNQEAYWDLEVSLARVQLLEATGKHREAHRLAERVVRDATARWSDVLLHRAETLLAALWIDHGNLALARAWAEKTSLSVDSWPRTFGQPLAHSVLAHFQIVDGRPWDALATLETVIAEGKRRKHTSPLIRAHALSALAHANLGQTAEAVAALAQAEQLGARGAFVRAFLVSGIDVRIFAHRDSAAIQTPLRTTLSKREMEILRLLDRGLDTRDIASQLSISVFTVKTHLSKLYSKLDAKGRTHALSVARAQGIL